MRILAATDESVGGRHAVQFARSLAERAGSSLTILTVRPVNGGDVSSAGSLVSSEGPRSPAFERFTRWLGPDGRGEVAVAAGIPGVEITRFAGLRDVGLIVLGRRARAPDQPLLLGETSDGVVRRSAVPVLFVPERVNRLGRVLVAVDGGERSASVLEAALTVAGALGAEFRAVTVEPELADELGPRFGPPIPRGRSVRLAGWLSRFPASARVGLVIRRGDPVDEILTQLEETGADALAIGYRRGGPPQVVGPTAVARNLLCAAPSAVLTVPL